MKPTIKPTPEQITELITKINDKLAIKAINKYVNAPIKEGYTDCLRILNDRLTNPENNYGIPENEAEVVQITEIYRNLLKGIEKLNCYQARSMAVICVDFLNGEDAAFDKLLNIAFK